MHFSFVIVALTALLPLASSTSTSSGAKSCKQNEFWWTNKNCCLPSGGPPAKPTPPKGSECPPAGYYWGEKQGCCVPKYNPPANPPTPQCPKNWTWYPLIHKCLPTPKPPTPPAPQPSKGYHQSHKKRAIRAHTTLCPIGLDACPIANLTTGEYECIDTATELESCGGCTSQGKGQDCTAIKGAWNVGCEQHNCVVYSCAGGFEIGFDGKSCNLL